MDADVIRLQRETLIDYKVLRENPQYIKNALFFLPLCTGLMWILSLVKTELEIFEVISHGLIFGFGFAVLYVLYRARNHTNWHEKLFYPAQKLHLTLRRVSKIVVVTGVVLSLSLSVFTALYLSWPGNVSFSLRVGFLLAIILGFLFYGGIEIVKHLALRWTLFRNNMAPWRYTPFLEYAKQTGLLRPRGEGYAFEHEWFQDYFAKIVRV